jgi:hypothetical protein
MSIKEHVPYDTLMSVDFDGQTWELRTDTNHARSEAYCAHINCTFEHQDDQYSGLWSWEKGDHIESDNGLPWCHYCHVTVPDEVQALIALLDKGEECWKV